MRDMDQAGVVRYFDGFHVSVSRNTGEADPPVPSVGSDPTEKEVKGRRSRMRARSFPARWLVGIAWMLAGCASGGTVQPPALGLEPTEEVVVRPGDQIELGVYMEPEMSGSYAVLSTGEVYLPKVGAVQVAGQPVPQVEASLREAYGQFLRNPSVTLRVLRRVAVQGEVRNPNLYLVDTTVTLRDIIAQAGGITPSGDADKVTLVRGGVVYDIPANDVHLLAAELESGDQIVVGRTNWFERNSVTLATSVPTFVLTLLTVIDWFGGS